MSEIACPLFGTKTNTSVSSLQLDAEYNISISKTIDNPSCWDSLAKDNIYLSSKFLNFVVANPPSDISSRFVSIYKDEKLKGIVYFQIKDLNLGRAMRLDRQKSKFYDLLKKIRHSILSLVNQKILICGNTLVTGDNAFVIQLDISPREKNELVHACIESVIAEEKKVGNSIRSILVKDFYKDISKSKIQFDHAEYTDFEVQPNMIFQLHEDWKSFDDYLAAMKAKSRTRIKRAIKKSTELEFKTLTVAEIEEHNEEIYNLYKSTSDNASFNLFLLSKNYFLNFAKTFSSKFKLHGVFKQNQLIAFYTTIEESKVLDAHFLGYNRDENYQHQLYLNILLKLVQRAIYLQKKELCLSRTAMEIKSSIGAEGFEMNTYLRSKNSLINKSLKRILDSVAPKEEWVPRNPFKK